METAFITLLFVIGLAGLPCVPLGALFGAGTRAELMGMTLSRTVYAGCFLIAAVHLGLSESLSLRGGKRLVLPCLAGMLVAVNNLPVLALLWGTAGVDWLREEILLLALECLAVAAFEETAFRGIVFPLLLQHFGAGKRGRFEAVLLAACLFGLAHFLNIFTDGLAAIAQVGYSFLIGAMLCVLLFEGANVWLCALIHAVYNFCGLVVPAFGTGDFWDIWNPATIVLTVLIAVGVAAYLAVRLWRSDAQGVRFVRFPHFVRRD